MNTQNKQKHGGGGGRGKICVKVAMGVMGLCLGGYIVGPSLYWHISEPISSLRRSSCPPCLCDCSFHPLLSLPQGLNDTIFPGTNESILTITFGMETCEEAREKAEASLEAQRELSVMWELKARQKGWKDGPVKSRLRSLSGERMEINDA
ncbi:uncharacterized protein LOC130794943 [Actinidia eriantha]|uniref:uncharacterized protein LOC130794943 n=1 Tax=Actinidia eriantha TaxID=165200 RepID=UPI0025874879|nr:uncharacterized protein LOC130794943 [Actinidia eriantha]